MDNGFAYFSKRRFWKARGGDGTLKRRGLGDRDWCGWGSGGKRRREETVAVAVGSLAASLAALVGGVREGGARGADEGAWAVDGPTGTGVGAPVPLGSCCLRTRVCLLHRLCPDFKKSSV